MSEVFVPLGYQILLRPDPPQSGLIQAPDSSAKPRPESGIVEAVGKAVDRDIFTPGRRIVFNSAAVNRMTVGDRDYILITAEQARGFIYAASDSLA